MCKVHRKRVATSVAACWSCIVFLTAGAIGQGVLIVADLSAFTPPPCSGVMFSDIDCGSPLAAWIEQLARDGVSDGCGGGRYCPQAPVTRAQAALLLERAMRGTSTWRPVHYVRTILVSPVVGDPVASGTALRNAIDGIADATATNPYLVKIEPGIFDLENDSLMMKDFVDIEGSGRHRTLITALGGPNPNRGTVVGGRAELRALKAEARAPGSNLVAMLTRKDVRIKDAELATRDGADTLAAWGLLALSTNATMDDVAVLALGTSGSAIGIGVEGGQMTLNNVSVDAGLATGRGETRAFSGTEAVVLASDVSFRAFDGGQATTALFLIGAGPDPSRIRGARMWAAGGALATRGVYVEGHAVSFDGFDIEATLGRDGSTGIEIGAADQVEFSRGVVRATTYAAHLLEGASVVFNGVDLIGGKYGVYLESADMSFSGGSIVTTCPFVGCSTGVFGSGYEEPHSIRLHSTRIEGSWATVFAATAYTIQIGDSQLAGGPSTGGYGTVQCAGVYDEDFVFYPSTCPD